MGVTIIDPPIGKSFPYDEGWMATVTIGSDDGVDGTLTDTNTKSVYPDNGAIFIGGPDSHGLYTWNVPFSSPFTPQIKLGQNLKLFCYDNVTGLGANWTGTASTTAIPSRKLKAAKKTRKLKAIRSATPIDFNDNDTRLDTINNLVDARLTLPAQMTGIIFLVLINENKDPATDPSALITYRYCLTPADDEERFHTFKGINATMWTHIYVMAVTPGHQGYKNGKLPVRWLQSP